MLREINPDFGFQSAQGVNERTDLTGKLQSIGLVAVRKRFSPSSSTASIASSPISRSVRKPSLPSSITRSPICRAT